MEMKISGSSTGLSASRTDSGVSSFIGSASGASVVLVVSVLPLRHALRASVRVTQGSIAHFTRTGNFLTPSSASRSPRSAPAGAGAPCMTARNASAVASASAAVWPGIISAMIEPDAVQMAHPRPWTSTPVTRSPSRAREITTSSPHTGLKPWARASTRGSGVRPRGRRWWSSTTSR